MSASLVPSLMSVDVLNIQSELEQLDSYASHYHADIIDWHYIKNMCLTPWFVAQVKPVTKLPIEAHLYMDTIDEGLIELCMDSGCSLVTMPHDVIGRSIHRYAKLIHDRSGKMGVFINPSEPVSVIRPIANVIDELLILAVDPGFSGQDFIPETYSRLEEACAIREELGAHYSIAVDGGCSASNTRDLVLAGADCLIMGRGIFEQADTVSEAARLTTEAILKASNERSERLR